MNPDTVVSDPKLTEEAKKAQDEAARRMKEEQERQENAERQQQAKTQTAKEQVSRAHDHFGLADGPVRTTPSVNPEASREAPIPGSDKWIPGAGDASGDSPGVRAVMEINKQAAKQREQK